MKKPAVSVLVLVTCIFASFVAGFFAGRSLNRAPVRIWQAAPAATEARTEPASETVTTPAGPVNINTATADQLETLPGIGPVLAQRIIDYRTENGDFRAPEELSRVKGIGAGKLEAILDLITIGGEE